MSPPSNVEPHERLAVSASYTTQHLTHTSYSFWQHVSLAISQNFLNGYTQFDICKCTAVVPFLYLYLYLYMYLSVERMHCRRVVVGASRKFGLIPSWVPTTRCFPNYAHFSKTLGQTNKQIMEGF